MPSCKRWGGRPTLPPYSALSCRRWGWRPTRPLYFALGCKRGGGRLTLPPYASANAGFTLPSRCALARGWSGIALHMWSPMACSRNVLPGRKRRFLEYCSILDVTLFLPKCNFQELENLKFQNHGLLEIICFAKRGGWFEKSAPGSPPRHDAQLRLVNAQKAQLRGVVGFSLCTCHIFCSPIFGSHLHNS